MLRPSVKGLGITHRLQRAAQTLAASAAPLLGVGPGSRREQSPAPALTVSCWNVGGWEGPRGAQGLWGAQGS